MDDDLLSAIDKDDDVRKHGRSAVFRQLAAEYVKRKKEEEIESLYIQAYRDEKAGLGDEFGGWEREGVWPVK